MSSIQAVFWPFFVILCSTFPPAMGPPLLLMAFLREVPSVGEVPGGSRAFFDLPPTFFSPRLPFLQWTIHLGDFSFLPHP